MIHVKPFIYKPGEHENERASNSYLMSVIAVMVGLPLPIINLIATLIFYVGNRKSTFFVRWHCTQALLSQFSLLFMNSAAFYWTLAILFDKVLVSNLYVGYIITVVLYNFAEFVATVYTAIQSRKGIHVEWWLYATITDRICKPNPLKDKAVLADVNTLKP